MIRLSMTVDIFLQLLRTANFFVAIWGASLYAFDLITNHRTKLYLDFMRWYVQREVRDAVAHYHQNATEIQYALKAERKKNFFPKTPIWVCWLQGEEHMPWIVKKCYENLQCKVDPEDAQVVLVTLDNYADFVEIEDSVCDKLKKGILTYTNFSDYLRVKLLAVYGGLWIDSTVYVTKPIDKQLLSRPFYSQKTNTEFYVRRYVSQSRWASWLMLTDPDRELFSFVASVMRDYYLRCNGLPDYYFIDYIIEIAYEQIDSVRRDMDTLEFNNEYSFRLFNDMFSEEYDAAAFQDVYEKTQFFKFTYKDEHKKVTPTGKETNFGYFCRVYLEDK